MVDFPKNRNMPNTVSQWKQCWADSFVLKSDQTYQGNTPGYIYTRSMLQLSCRKLKVSTHSQRVVVSPFRTVYGIVNSLKRERACTNLEAKWHNKGKNLHAPTIFISLLLSPRTMYCDETADECSGINVHQPTAFAHKLLQLSGVSFFWDEFPASTKSSPVCSATQLVK